MTPEEWVEIRDICESIQNRCQAIILLSDMHHFCVVTLLEDNLEDCQRLALKYCVKTEGEKSGVEKSWP